MVVAGNLAKIICSIEEYYTLSTMVAKKKREVWTLCCHFETDIDNKVRGVGCIYSISSASVYFNR